MQKDKDNPRKTVTEHYIISATIFTLFCQYLITIIMLYFCLKPLVDLIIITVLQYCFGYDGDFLYRRRRVDQ